MNEKHERTRAKHLFYCFVDFGKTVSDRPSTFVVPSNVVAKVVAASHKKWLADPGKNGQRRKDCGDSCLLTNIFPIQLGGWKSIEMPGICWV
jgi:hypothetical protein